MIVELSDDAVIRLVLRAGVVLATLAGGVLLARGRRRAGLTADEAAAVSAWKARVDGRFGLATLLVWAGAFAGLVYGLHHLELYRDRQLPPFLFLHCPGGAPPSYLPWAPPAAVLASVVAVAGRRLLMRAVLGPMQVRVYRRATRVATGFDPRRPGRVLAVLLVLLALIWVVLDLDWYCRVDADRVVVNRLWSVGETSYAYADVALLVESSHWQPVGGVVRACDRFHIVFRDGTCWTVAGSAADRRPLVAHLSRATGLRPVAVPLLDDVLGGRPASGPLTPLVRPGKLAVGDGH